MARRFFRIFPDGGHGMVWPDQAVWLERRDTYNGVKRPGLIDGWVELVLELRPLERGESFADCLPCVKGFDVYSERMRTTIEAVLLPGDVVQWLPTIVADGTGDDRRRYWVMHPPHGPEAVDQEASTRAPEPIGLVKAVLDPEKVADRHVMKYPYGFPPIVSEEVRHALEQAGCSGMHFERVPTSSGPPRA